jgi:O-glycosyl hydrolase
LPEPQSDWREISYKDFDMQASGGRPQIFIDFGKAIRQLSPDAKLIGTVWSPPAWMKQNDSITDTRSSGIRASGYGEARNRVRKEYFPHFCKWMVEYVKKHDEEGAPLYAVSAGNEIQFSQSFESCVWDAKDYVTILPMLRSMLDEAGYQDVKIFGPETMTSHMYDGGTGSYVGEIKKDNEALAAIDVFATHGYEDGVVEEMSANSSRVFWNLIQDTGKPFWITEGGTGGHDWPTPIQKGVANAIHNALVGGNCSAFVPWQICERQKSTHGLMVTDGYTDKSHAARHYFKFVRPGAVRIEASPAFGELHVGAFIHDEDQQLVIVAINSTESEQTVDLRLNNVPSCHTFDLVRTSAKVKFEPSGTASIDNSVANLSMPPMSMLTAIASLSDE